MEKKTKMEYFEELRRLVIDAVTDVTEQDEYLEFIDKEMEAIEKRRAAQKERAEKKRAESDVLTDRIFDVLVNEYLTLDDIMVHFADEEDITRNKVTARLGKLVKLGKVEKESMKTDSKSRKMAYRKVEESAA